MVKIIKSERAGKNGKLGVGCSAAIFDINHENILLIQRADNGKWAVPGGYMEPGENFSEACAREVFEETGLHIQVKHLISIYTDPDILLEYPDGNRWQLVVLHFETEVLKGELTTSNESTDVKFFTQNEAKNLDIGWLDRLRIEDSFASQKMTMIRNELGGLD
jgi:ADP-ribose pyrophosphatase YjhB (NUDIX family)